MKAAWLELNRQLAFEGAGAQAAHNGKRRADCPFNQETQSFQWNHWVYGNDNCWGELQRLKQGTIEFLNENGEHCFTITTQEAYETGQWEPQYVTVPDHWKKPEET